MCGAPVRDISHVTPLVIEISGAVAIVSVVIRCATSDSLFSLDNIFSVVALATAVPISIIGLYMPDDGFGKDVWTLTPRQISRTVKVILDVMA